MKVVRVSEGRERESERERVSHRGRERDNKCERNKRRKKDSGLYRRLLPARVPSLAFQAEQQREGHQTRLEPSAKGLQPDPEVTLHMLHSNYSGSWTTSFS